MEAEEKRISRSYKAQDTPYRNAMKRATEKDKTNLAIIIEDLVCLYSEGYKILVEKKGDVSYAEWRKPHPNPVKKTK